MTDRRFLALALATVALWPLAATAADNVKIGFPIPLSGPTAVYGKPVLAGAEWPSRKSMLRVASLAASSNFCRGIARQTPMRRCVSRGS